MSTATENKIIDGDGHVVPGQERAVVGAPFAVHEAAAAGEHDPISRGIGALMLAVALLQIACSVAAVSRG